MEDNVHADSMNYAGTAQGPPSPAESDWDNDETGNEGDPRSEGQPVSSNIYSAYAQLRLYNKYIYFFVVTVSLNFFQFMQMLE